MAALQIIDHPLPQNVRLVQSTIKLYLSILNSLIVNKILVRTNISNATVINTLTHNCLLFLREFVALMKVILTFLSGHLNVQDIDLEVGRAHGIGYQSIFLK